MATFANVTPQSHADGVVYANSVPLTSNEADVYNGTALDGQDPIQVVFGQAVQAIVQLKQVGGLTGQNTYVVMQTDLGDGVWVDVAGIVYTNTNVPGIFLLSGGVAGNNAFQQTRQAGGFPAANFSNAMVLGGRIRFVGKTVLSGGSSNAPGVISGMLVTITYKLLGLR